MSDYTMENAYVNGFDMDAVNKCTYDPEANYDWVPLNKTTLMHVNHVIDIDRVDEYPDEVKHMLHAIAFIFVSQNHLDAGFESDDVAQKAEEVFDANNNHLGFLVGEVENSLLESQPDLDTTPEELAQYMEEMDF
jgi:hypothetical protein